jgi:fatty-acyl-CoA synthase
MEKIKKVKHIKEDRKIRKEDNKIKRARFIADIQKLLQRKNKELPLFDLTIGQWLEKWAAETPDKEAIVYSDRDLRFTYAELNQRVNRLAKGFIEIGVTRGSHVGIWATNVPDWLTIMYACTKIGAICITVNTNYQQSELEYLCKDSDMQTLCLIDRDRDTDYIEMVYKMLPELRTCQRGELKSEKYPKMKNVVFIGQEKFRGMYNTQELFLLGDHTDDKKLNELRAQTNCHDVINMQYTSGTTGFPKGVMLTHYNIANNGFLTGEHMKFTSEDKVVLLCSVIPLLWNCACNNECASRTDVLK